MEDKEVNELVEYVIKHQGTEEAVDVSINLLREMTPQQREDFMRKTLLSSVSDIQSPEDQEYVVQKMFETWNLVYKSISDTDPDHQFGHEPG